MFKSRRILFLILVWHLLFISALPARAGEDTPARQPVKLQRADNMHWEPSTRTLKARGGVVVTWGEYRIYAGEVEYSEGEESLLARGNVCVIPKNGQSISADRLLVYLESGEIKVKKLDGKFVPWYAKIPVLEGEIDTHLTGPRAAFTTCDRENPHYWITAGRFHIYPGDRLVGYNAILWIGPAPVLYLPFFAIDLKDRLSRWDIRPGYSSEDGFMLDLGYRYLMEKDGWPVTGTAYSSLREYTGNGFGADVEYKRKDKYAYLYYFNSKRQPLVIEDGEEVRSGEEEDLWKIRSRVNYNFDDSKWKLHGEANWADYSRFNKEFDRDLSSRSESDRKFSGSLIRSGDNSFFRLDAERRDQVNDSGVFERHSSRMPRIRYQLFPVNVGWLGRGVYYRLDSMAQREYDLQKDLRLWEFYLNNSLIKSFSWTRWLGQSFRLGYRQNYNEQQQDKATDETEYESLGVGELRVQNTLRVFPGLSMDLIYNLEQRVNRKDEVKFELGGNDYGVEKYGREEHNIDLGIRYERDDAYFFLRGGYDLRSSDTFDIKTDSRIYSPRLNFNFPVTDFWNWRQFVSYDVQEDKIRQINTNWDFSLNRRLGTTFGWDYNRRPGDDFSKLKNQLNWESKNEQWRFQSDIVYDLKLDELEETRFMVYRRLHCWEMRVLYREILDRDRQIWITFNLTDYPSRALGFERDIDAGGYDLKEGNWQEIAE